jgi:hypothetical protein
MQSPLHYRFAAFAAVALGMLPLSSTAQIIFGPDAAMSTANWSLGASRVNLGSGYTGTLSNITTGNPDDALNLNISYTANTGSSFVAQFVKRDDWTYTPSLSGAITSIDFSGDFNSDSGIAISVGLLQGGVTYWTHPTANSGAINSVPYIGVSLTSLVDTNFVDLNGTGNPNFSSLGDEIIWGYFVRRGDTGTGARNINIGADNVAFAVIPEPSTVALLALGAFSGFLALRRRKT